MKLKTLLLGSAAAMLAVSGANAADAVIAEPEAVEYVRVCDTYGSGFFYIPGTETCLRISGYARVEYIYTTEVQFDANGLGVVGIGDDLDGDGFQDTRSEGRGVYRARVNFDARNETDYGTLRSQIRFQGSGDASGDAGVGVDRALITLGGLQFGYSDAFFTTHHGYGWQKAANDGFYTYDQAIMLQYTYAANGFSATIGVQDSVGATGGVTPAAVFGSENPDIYAGIAYSGSWGRVAGSVISDGFSDDLAWKVSADINVIEGLGIHGWYANDGGNTRFVTGYQSAAVEYEFGVDVNYQINSELNVWVGYSAFDGGIHEGSAFAVGAIWDPVPGLSIRPEAIFGTRNELAGGVPTGVPGSDFDYQQYRLRVVRSF